MRRTQHDLHTDPFLSLYRLVLVTLSHQYPASERDFPGHRSPQNNAVFDCWCLIHELEHASTPRASARVWVVLTTVVDRHEPRPDRGRADAAQLVRARRPAAGLTSADPRALARPGPVTVVTITDGVDVRGDGEEQEAATVQGRRGVPLLPQESHVVRRRQAVRQVRQARHCTPVP